MVNKTAEQVVLNYRAVFGDETGQRVLTHMLGELGFFNEIRTDNKDAMFEEVILHNYAVKLLSRCGFWNEGNIQDVVYEATTSRSRGGLIWSWFNRIIPSIFKEG